MRHKYLPRVRAGVLAPGAVLGAALVLVLGGCHDATAPAVPAGPRLLLDLEVPPSDSLAQLEVAVGVSRSDSALIWGVRIYVDSAANVQPITTGPAGCCSGPSTAFWAVVPLPGPGRHTITVLSADSLGRTLSASAAWTVRVADESYAATPLPDSGAGGGTRFVHASGTVTGWVAGQNGRRRPALWRNRALTVVGAVDSLDGVATRVNTAGDVLLEYRSAAVSYVTGAYVRVQRADGVMVPMPPTFYTDPTGAARTDTYTVCCDVGADLTDTRLALGTTTYYVPRGFTSAVLDVVRGTRVDSMYGAYVGLNNAGQAAGSTRDFGGFYPSTYLVTRGFKSAGLPNATIASPCDRGIGRYSTLVPIELDESGNLIANYCGNLVWLPTAPGASRWLDRVVGPSRSVHLSREGQIVASLDPAGTVYLWRPATARTTRVRVAGDAWRIDSLAAVNASGALAAHGVERATGRAAALLLTPASPPAADRAAAARPIPVRPYR